MNQIDIYQRYCSVDDYNNHLKNYPERLISKENGMGIIWVEESTGLEVARIDSGFSGSTYTIYLFKKR